MNYTFDIPNTQSGMQISIDSGSSIIFVGANGSGKTRLAVFIEEKFGDKSHRISAHRALNLNPAVPKISKIQASRKLKYGWDHESATIQNRKGSRWPGNEPAVSMLNDFDSLLQVMFADQSITTLETHQKHRQGTLTSARETKFETLSDIWSRLLPHRKLIMSGDDITVMAADTGDVYPASDMSDGERAIFYLISQALVADESSLLIIDEPELHVHPSIMSSFWDEIEAARKDCAFLFITHDLQFAAARTAQKYVINKFLPFPSWTIEKIPEDIGFSEEITTLILGSRRPVLFIEGDETSLDLVVYRCCYPEWTVIPRGSCEQVVHSVVTMRANSQLTRIKCAGIVDSDDYTTQEIDYFNALYVFPLKVSEIENLFLLPAIGKSIAQLEGYSNQEIDQQLEKLKSDIFSLLRNQSAIDEVVVKYCKRRIDRTLKKIDLSNPTNISDLIVQYNTKTAALNIENIALEATQKIQRSIETKDLSMLLTIYSNKGMLAFAAQHLKQTKLSSFKSWLTRILGDNKNYPELHLALKSNLPSVQIPQI